MKRAMVIRAMVILGLWLAIMAIAVHKTQSRPEPPRPACTCKQSQRGQTLYVQPDRRAERGI